MNEPRFVVSDVLWQRLEPHIPGKPSDAGGTAKNNRLFLEAVFWRVRTGSAWRDLPPSFGHWNTQFRRHRRWARAGVFESLFKAMSEDADLEYALIDGTIVRVHQKATGAKGGAGLRPSGARWAKRWPDDKNCGLGGRARQPGALLAAAGTST